MPIPYATIACCIDPSEASREVLAEGAALRALSPGRLVVVHVTEGLVATFGPPGSEADPLEVHEAGRLWLEAQAAPVGAETALLTGEPAPAVCEWAAESGVDVLLAGRHRGFLDRVTLGSFAGYLVHHAPCAVLLMPPPRRS
jgi:nucleotide-binding universal stress UspA family protein